MPSPDSRSRIEEVDLGVQAPEVARVMLVQANSDAADWAYSKGLAQDQRAADRRRFIDWILVEATRHTADILIFPELSITKEAEPRLQLWSTQTGGIIVGGSHYFETKKEGTVARCPIFCGGTVYYTEKLVPAPVEVSPIAGQGLSEGRKLMIIRSSTAGDFAVTICSDFLDPALREAVIEQELDLLVVPAFQKDSETYHSRMNLEIEESRHGLFIVYANMLCPGHGDGRSAVFGQMDRIFQTKLQEAGFTNSVPQSKVFEFDPKCRYSVFEFRLQDKKPYARRSVSTRPNIRIVSVDSPGDRVSDQFTRKIAHQDERYARIKNLFVPPAEYEEMLSALEEKRLLFIVGDPGIGKTYTAVRLLREYFERGFEPVWYAGLERADRLNQRRILESFDPQDREVVYFEDPFGRTSFERRDTVARTFGPLADRLEQIDARVVVTSRKEIFQQFSKESLSSVQISAFTQEMNVVRPSYSTESLKRILGRIAGGVEWASNPECRDAVHASIDSGVLQTPLALRDLVFSTTGAKSPERLQQYIQKRGTEERLLFAQDMEVSRVRTKLTLSIVFLFGGQDLATLAEWFNEVGRFLDPSSDHWSGTAPLLTEIRKQTGYRIEQYGFKVSAYRFIHPRYEEAFVDMVAEDPIARDTIESLIKFVGRLNLTSAVHSALYHAEKYQDLALSLLKSVLPVIRSHPSLDRVAQIGLRIVTKAFGLRSEAFNQLVVKLVDLDELARRIDSENDLNAIAQALRFVDSWGAHLRRAVSSGSDWKSRFVSGLDVPKLSRKCEEETNFRKVSEVLIELARFDVILVQRYLGSRPREEFLARIQSLPTPQRVKLAAIPEHGSDLHQFISESLGKDENLIPANGIRAWLVRNTKPKDGIVIDHGAAQAIRSGYTLLPVGVTQVLGTFSREQAVAIYDEELSTVGVGIAAYSSEEIARILGHHSSEISTLLGSNYGAGVIRLGKVRFN